MNSSNFINDVIEGRSYAIPFSMKYSENWTEEEKQGQPIERSHVEKIVFQIKRREGDIVPRVSLSDENNDEIDWVDEEGGKIHVLLNQNTSGSSGYNVYELMAEFLDGSRSTLEKGRIFICPSVISNS